MKRRHFLHGGLTVAGVGLLAGCGIPFGPSVPPARRRRIGYLATGTPASNAPNLAAFRQGMSDLGYVENQDFTLELRHADGMEERLPEFAAELVRLGVDVILGGGTAATRVAGQATTTIPIVFTAAGVDPVAEGLVASLSRPGGNMTGLTTYAGQENAKRLQLFKDAFPGVSRVGILWNQTGLVFFREMEAAAQQLGLQVISLELRPADDLGTVLDRAIAGGAGGILVVSGATLVLLASRIVEFAARHRLPAMYSNSPFVNEEDGLMSYSASNLENYRRAATYIDKILKGARPGDLPIERPARYDFIINLKTAQALGLIIPQSVLAQATEVIQ